MKKLNFGLQAVVVFGFSPMLVVLIGCGQADNPSQSTSPDTGAHAGHADEGEQATYTPDDGHAAHPTEGPHHGELVELGQEEYHIEIVHDDEAGTVTAYVLDTTAKLAVPIEATEIMVNLSHDGQAEQFALGAVPQEGDPAGKSSRFVSAVAELAEDLDNEAITAQLVVTINGKQFRVSIQHSDEGHDAHAEESGDHDDEPDGHEEKNK